MEKKYLYFTSDEVVFIQKLLKSPKKPPTPAYLRAKEQHKQLIRQKKNDH